MKKITIIAAALLLAGAAQAQKAAPSPFYGELGYTALNIKVDAVNADIDVGALRAVGGWNVHPYVAIEAMLGTGVREDNSIGSLGFKTKLNSMAGLYVKPKYDFGNGFEVFGRLGYSTIKTKLSGGGSSAKTEDSDVSFGIGANYSFSSKVYGTVDYTQYFDQDGAKATGVTLGVGYRF